MDPPTALPPPPLLPHPTHPCWSPVLRRYHLTPVQGALATKLTNKRHPRSPVRRYLSTQAQKGGASGNLSLDLCIK